MTESVERSLAVLRAEISPSSADKARLRARILAPGFAGLAPSSGAGLDGATPSVSGVVPAAAPQLTRWAALQAAGSLALAGGVALLGAGVGLGFWLGREPAFERASSRVEQVSSVALPAAGVPEPAIPEPAPIESAPAAAAELEQEPAAEARAAANDTPAPRATRPRAKPRAALPQPLNDELALLQRVERALRKGDPALALALLRELDERFPESRLVEERLAARHMADCRIEAPDAVARARRFLDEHPLSVYRQRIQLACPLGGDNPGLGPQR